MVQLATVLGLFALLRRFAPTVLVATACAAVLGFNVRNPTPGYHGLSAALLVAIQGARFILAGKGFFGFLALCMVAFIVLVIHGYRQEAE